VTAGYQNEATALNSAVHGGRFNDADSTYSSILGGNTENTTSTDETAY